MLINYFIMKDIFLKTYRCPTCPFCYLKTTKEYCIEVKKTRRIEHVLNSSQIIRRLTFLTLSLITHLIQKFVQNIISFVVA